MAPLLGSEQFFDTLALLVLLLARVGGFLAVAPVFDNQALPASVKVLLSLMLTLLLFPVVDIPAPARLLPDGLLLVVGQVVTGIALAFALRIVFAGASLAGYLVGQQMGLGFAALQDPQNGAQIPLTSRLYMVALTLSFLALDGHLLMIGALADSYRWLPLGEGGPQGLVAATLEFTGHLFSLATAIALPAVAALLMVNLSFGVLTRAAPQMNILVVGFPVTLLLGLLLLLVTLPGGIQRLNDELLLTVQQLPGMLDSR